MKIYCLLFILLIAAGMDLCIRKVKNPLIIMGFIVGFLCMYLERGPSGIAKSVIGMILPLCLLIFYRFHQIGAGDIKLLCVCGVFLGPKELIQCLPYIIFSAAVMAFLTVVSGYLQIMIHQGVLPIFQKMKLKYQNVILTKEFISTKEILLPRENQKKIPLAIAIFTGVLWREFSGKQLF